MKTPKASLEGNQGLAQTTPGGKHLHNNVQRHLFATDNWCRCNLSKCCCAVHTCRPKSRVCLCNLFCHGVCSNGESHQEDRSTWRTFPYKVHGLVHVSRQRHVQRLGISQWRVPTTSAYTTTNVAKTVSPLSYCGIGSVICYCLLGP